MNTLTTVLVITIVLQTIIILVLMVKYYNEKTLAAFYLEEWRKWEQRWHVTQQLVLNELNVWIRIDGIKSKIRIEKREEDR